MDRNLRFSLKPNSGLPIAAAITEYVTELYAKRNIAVFELGYDFLIIMKGTSPEQWVKPQKPMGK